jgi:hypothetical protein
MTNETYAATRARIAATTYDLDKVPYVGVEVDADGEGYCPKCGSHYSNGFCTYEDICESSKSAAGQMVREYTCLGCGGEWGPLLKRTARSTKPKQKHGVKIQKVRVTQNGVTRPSAGGKCDAVWVALDGMVAPTSAMIKEWAADNGQNVNNATTEFSQWRKFNGLTK